MPVSASIKIEQIESSSRQGSVRSSTVSVSATGGVRNQTSSASSVLQFTHLNQPSNPEASASKQGWPTEDKEDWSDSPTFNPLTLYRHRFGWGRDNREIPAITPGTDGSRWGNLDDDSGQIIYQRAYTISSSTYVRSFRATSPVSVRSLLAATTSVLSSMRAIEGRSGEATVSQFPFSLLAVPEPFSEKNPIDTDVYIRLSNYAQTVASGTITMYIDGIARSGLDIQPFFGGLGGFDVTWNNDDLFEYDTEVRVRVVFQDNDVLANTVTIEYPFYTVQDLLRPRIRNPVPSNNRTGVAINTSIRFEVVDFEVGVDTTSMRLYVDGRLIRDGIDGTVSFTPLVGENGYTVNYTPNKPFLYGDLIAVAVFIKDTSENQNELFYTYSFTTEESLAPEVAHRDPESCSTDISVLSSVELCVVDGGNGLEKDSIIISIDEKEPVGMVIMPVIYRKE